MMRTVFCDKCGFDVTETEIEELCPYWECDGAEAFRNLDANEVPRAGALGDRAQEG